MAKGSQYEREFCKRLSLWWTDGEHSDVFWRTSNSGGRATVRAKKGKTTANQYGDVCAIDPIGQPLIDVVTIELKRGYKSATIHDLLDASENSATQQFEKWIDKIQEDSKLAGTPYWLLNTRRDRRKPLVWMPGIFWERWLPHIHTELHIETVDYWIFGTTWELWLDEVEPEAFRKIAKTL